MRLSCADVQEFDCLLHKISKMADPNNSLGNLPSITLENAESRTMYFLLYLETRSLRCARFGSFGFGKVEEDQPQHLYCQKRNVAKLVIWLWASSEVE